jgi:hypothetical protein
MPAEFSQLLVAGEQEEPSAEYVRRNSRKVDGLVSDLRALESWSDRWQLLREHVFPSATYMEQAYHVGRRALLPAYYAKRIAEGARGWLRKR